MSDEEGTAVLHGKLVIPKGVAVEELNSWRKKLTKECPKSVEELLTAHNLLPTYHKLVDAVVADKKTHGGIIGGTWRDKEMLSVIDLFRDEFAEGGVRVALCKRESGSGIKHWFEFIDTAVATNYVPQFDVGNLSGQVIKTLHGKVEFANGVAAEELKQRGDPTKELKEKCPIYVQNLLEKKDLLFEYNSLVDELANEGTAGSFLGWDIEKIKEIIHNHKDSFLKKGVEIFACQKQELVTHGQFGAHTENIRWIEFVDRELQPNYHPQRDADDKDEKEACVVS